MQVSFAYRRRSAIHQAPSGLEIALSPNIRRDRVGFDGRLCYPLRFREAISALHDVVVSDLRFKPRDRSAYEAYLQQQRQRESAIRSAAFQNAKQQANAKLDSPMPEGLEHDYNIQRRRYWKARDRYNRYLITHDWEMWRLLMPCDPVITVAPDVLFFECFSADESSYGCLTVDRSAFEDQRDVTLGTTNVDYSWALYEHFQKLRSYRKTRFQVDPSGFEVSTDSAASHHEEKIDLPGGWLRGFMQLQSAMSLPGRKVSISREGLYNVIAFLKRHRAAKSPRAVRFELEPGKPTSLVLEPWDRRIVLHDVPFSGPRSESIRVWGRDRLRVLERLLPIADGVDVYLLGTGLPSFWVVRMGEMRLILGLSGWTTNDWTSASAMEAIAPPVELSESTLLDVAETFKENPTLSLEQIQSRVSHDAATVAAALNRLALLGQVIHDLSAGVYRWRQVMPTPLTMDQIGNENPENAAARELLARGRVKVLRDETTSSGLRLVTGKAGDRNVELMLDGDRRIKRGKCDCSHHFKNGLRMGPCRHLQALRNSLLAGADAPQDLGRWYDGVLKNRFGS